MRIYHHPAVGDYYKRKSFEWGHALGTGIGGLSLGAVLRGLREKKSPLMEGITSLGAGLAGGTLVPKRVLSWFDPPPFNGPVIYPRLLPKVVVPSLIGENGQVLNLLTQRGVGDVVRDYSGFKNHGTLLPVYPTNVPTWVDGSYGWALDYEGVEDYVNCGKPPSLDFSDALTIEAWVKTRTPTNPAGYSMITSRGTEGIIPWHMFSTRAEDRIQFWWYEEGLAYSYKQVLTPVPHDVWHDLAVTLNATTREIKFYVNGSQVGLTQNYAGSWSFAGTKDLYIGRYHTYYINALIALFRISNRDLSPTELSHHFESTRAIFGV